MAFTPRSDTAPAVLTLRRVYPIARPTRRHSRTECERAQAGIVDCDGLLSQVDEERKRLLDVSRSLQELWIGNTDMGLMQHAHAVGNQRNVGVNSAALG